MQKEKILQIFQKIKIQGKNDPKTKSWFIEQTQNNKDNKITIYYNNDDIITQINSIQIIGTKKICTILPQGMF